jgi:hypothetical protein
MTAADAQAYLLSSYRRLLETGLRSRYQFLGFGDIGNEAAPLSCLLRHDVDAELFGIDAMAEIEKSLGVSATYFLMTRSTAYNLFCLEGSRVVSRLLEAGHRIGLHFMGELCERDSVEVLAEKVRREADWLEREFGTKIDAVSFHQPSRAILDGKIQVRGLVNTYNQAQMGRYFYVADTNMTWRQEPPAEIFERKLHPRLQLLIHPMWWSERALGPLDKWRAILATHRKTLIEHWRARERTLTTIDPKDLEI